MFILEDKKDKFERLAERRTNEAIKKIRLLGNLSNKSTYEYEKDHVLAIITSLEKEIKQLKARFENENKGKEFSFKNNKQI